MFWLADVEIVAEDMENRQKLQVKVLYPQHIFMALYKYFKDFWHHRMFDEKNELLFYKAV